MGNQWGKFTFASPQPKCWGDVSPRSPYNRRPWLSTRYDDRRACRAWRNFPSPEFGTKYQREVPLFCVDTCRISRKKPPRQSLWIEHRLVGCEEGQSSYRAGGYSVAREKPLNINGSLKHL